jgi:hypothetical protein
MINIRKHHKFAMAMIGVGALAGIASTTITGPLSSALVICAIGCVLLALAVLNVNI